jgi:cell division protein FtsI (penicillin-binding protein 3)
VNIFQIVKALNIFPSGGQLITPTFARAIRYEDSFVNIPKKVEGTLFSPQLIATMLPVLETVVTDGTGKLARVDGIRIAGKTGTAQKAGVGGYNDETYYAIFYGFFPVEDPVYTLYIVIDTPKAGIYYGGFIAAPLFSSIVKKLYKIDVEEEKYEGVYAWKMPDLTGYSLRDVSEVAGLYGIETLVINGSGQVIKQFPDIGQPLEDFIEVWLGVDDGNAL